MNSNKNTGLNEIQLTLLRLFNRQISDKDTEEIKMLLVKHLRQKLDVQVEADIKRNGITREDFDQVLNKSQRTKLLK
jgi:hypothetical protein